MKVCVCILSVLRDWSDVQPEKGGAEDRGFSLSLSQSPDLSRRNSRSPDLSAFSAQTQTWVREIKRMTDGSEVRKDSSCILNTLEYRGRCTVCENVKCVKV